MNYGQSAFAPLRFTTPTLDELAARLAAKQWTGETGIWAELPVVKGGDRPPFGLSHRISAIFTLFLPPPLDLCK